MADDKVNKFNVIEDMKQPVYIDKETPDFPPPTRPRGNWAPADGASDWGKVKTVWNSVSNDPDEAVRLWSERLGFVKDSVSGKRPSVLLSRFERLVPAAPLIGKGNA